MLRLDIHRERHSGWHRRDRKRADHLQRSTGPLPEAGPPRQALSSLECDRGERRPQRTTAPQFDIATTPACIFGTTRKVVQEHGFPDPAKAPQREPLIWTTGR